MKVDEIKKVVHAEPFRPFYLHIADGGRLLVTHPDFIAISGSGRSMLVYPEGHEDDYQAVDTALVTRIEQAKRSSSSK
jgi:hypothetical protein